MQRKISALALKIILIAPALRAVELTPWDAMKARYSGAITVTTKAGKRLKSNGPISFTPTAVLFGQVTSVSRQDVKEVVIREEREICCDALVLGILPLVALVDGIRNHHLAKDTFPLIIIYAPLSVAAAAVTGPPLLAIEGIRRLKPSKLLYKVVP